LVANYDIARLPLGSHQLLIFGGTADAFRKMRKSKEADDFEAKFEAKKKEMLESYALTRATAVTKVTPSRKLYYMRRRYI
jgi:hypothetical protein